MATPVGYGIVAKNVRACECVHCAIVLLLDLSYTESHNIMCYLYYYLTVAVIEISIAKMQLFKTNVAVVFFAFHTT